MSDLKLDLGGLRPLGQQAPLGENCGACKFGRLHPMMLKSGDTSQRICKRYPPTVGHFMVPGPQNRPQIMSHAGWPMVQSTEWCGEFKRRAITESAVDADVDAAMSMPEGGMPS